MPEWVEIVVPEAEFSTYSEAVENPLIVTPNDVIGLGRLRNWCLDFFEEETVIMLDDDIQHFYCLTGEKTRQVNDPEEVIQVLINTAVMAKDIGAKVFGFSQTDIRKYSGCDPFCLCSWIGTIIGVIGRKYRFRNDKFKVDIDYCLQNLLVERIVWIDNRYYASNIKDVNSGGNALFRTDESFQKSIDSLAEKWGECLRISGFKNQVKIRFNFNRKQKVKI